MKYPKYQNRTISTRKIRRAQLRMKYGSDFGNAWRNLMSLWRKGKVVKP